MAVVVDNGIKACAVVLQDHIKDDRLGGDGVDLICNAVRHFRNRSGKGTLCRTVTRQSGSEKGEIGCKRGGEGVLAGRIGLD